MPELKHIPHIQQYLGLWSIEASAAARMQQIFTGSWTKYLAEFQSRIDEGEHSPSAHGYELTPEGVAIIDLEGVLTKYGSSFSMGGSTVRLRKALRNAREDAAVQSILLAIESPGGSTMGTPEAAAEVAATAKIKPVHAYIEDIGASAAYWIASQANTISANAAAMVGSIGTYFAVDDVSRAFTKAGIKTHFFTTGPHKGAGYMGTALTDEQRAEFQSLVERMNAPFVAAVKAGRGLDDAQLAEVTDGRCWRGDEAVAVGLIDEVKTYDEALAALSSQSATPTKGTVMPRASTTKAAKSAKLKSEEPEKDEAASEEEEEEMESEDETADEAESEDEEKEKKPAARKKSKSQDEEEEKPASLAALKAALPEADSDFLIEALESRMSVAQARMSWMEQTIAAQAKKIEELESNAPRPGAKPLGTAGGKSKSSGDVITEWKAAVKECGSNSKAVKQHPELHAAYIEAVNARRVA